MAEDYISQNPYTYAANDSIKFIDYLGLGIIYGEDGSFIEDDGKDDDKAYVRTNTFIEDENGNITLGDPVTTLLSITNSELLTVAGAVFGESDTQNRTNEMMAIASAIVNNNELSGDPSLTVTTIRIAFAATDGNRRTAAFKSTTAAERNDTDMQTAIFATINAITGGRDFSNGATGWDGADLKTNSHRFGLNIPDPAHDIYNVGDRPLKTKENGSLYRRQTTAAHGGTVFMRIHPDFVKGGGRAY